MNRLSPRTLRYLYEVERFGSLRKAAAHLGVAPSAISRAMSKLEQDLNAAVMERTARGARLTYIGDMVLRHFHENRTSEKALISRIQAVQGLRQGEISIALGEGFIADLISAPLRAFMAQYPDITLTVEMAGASEAIRQVKDDEVDFALIYACPPEPLLHAHVSRRQPLDVIVPASHPLVRLGRPIAPHEVLPYPLGIMVRGFGMNQLISVLEYQTHMRFAPTLRSNSVTVLKNFVQSGIGIAFMPQLTVDAELAREEIDMVPVAHPLLQSATAKIVSRVDRTLSVAAQRIIEHLAQGMRFFSGDAPIVLDDEQINRGQQALENS